MVSNTKVYSAYFFTFLIGSTLCIIPDGEYQIGPIFGGPGNNRFLGNKHFEAYFDKGALKPLLTKKLILGVGAVGAGALAIGAAGLWKKHQQKGHGGYGHGNSHSTGYGNDQGYYGGGSDYYGQSQSQGSTGYYPATDYQYQYGQAQAQAYPSSSYNYQDQSSGYQYQQQDPSSSYSYDMGYSGYSR